MTLRQRRKKSMRNGFQERRNIIRMEHVGPVYPFLHIHLSGDTQYPLFIQFTLQVTETHKQNGIKSKLIKFKEPFLLSIYSI